MEEGGGGAAEGGGGGRPTEGIERGEGGGRGAVLVGGLRVTKGDGLDAGPVMAPVPTPSNTFRSMGLRT